MKILSLLAVVGIFVACTASVVNAQSISDCNTFSDVRPNGHSESPREKCQCEMDSSYCIQSVDQEIPFNSSSSQETVCRRNNKISVPGLGCKKCSSFAGLLSSKTALVITTITNKNLPAGASKTIVNKIGSAAAYGAVYAWCWLWVRR